MENYTSALRRDIALLNVYLQVITPHMDEEDPEQGTIKVVEVEDVDQGLNVPAMDVV